MTVLGFNGGCGGGVQSQATLDEAAEKRVQESKDAMKRFMAKKKAPEPSARKTSKK
jgi:Fe-S cluster biogenesis protein NfuA